MNDEAAHRLMRRAYEAEYRYPEGFCGFRAKMHYAWDGEGWGGAVEVRNPADIRYTGAAGRVDDHLRWEIASMIGHRWRIPYERAEGSLRLTLDARENPAGRTVRVEDGLDSVYRIRSGRIEQVERAFGDLRFTIQVQERLHTEGDKTLPVHYCIVYWSRENDRLVRTDIYRDGYVAVEGVYLPLSRRITTADDSGTTNRSVHFRDHEPLSRVGRRAAS
ncbi:DUF3386 family protein [Rubrobacter radiotolerans]|uniref:DUF3386 family protein n=1 Tax=Rubrobacter radiotolerans TaxID=42256 RepID=A0AB35T5B6_RUBRA|nr:DUF3386 family protein [Rubrobacter radiotolerans]MDX5895074.1 DUF3386 family protein [Rubrobacter radiotolerans]SMC07398.1 Protein of unknown function [Rubrobacter radiotolerans DSM 5868]